MAPRDSTNLRRSAVLAVPITGFAPRALAIHLGIPKAVLADRLAFLVEQGVLTKESGEYELTVRGKQLWPMIWSMITWGNENYLEKPNRRTYRHADCGGVIGPDRVCQRCARVPDVADLIAHPPQRPRDPHRDDPVSRALRRPHRMLEPIRAC